jgi:oxalate decarboxylase/phosphoglucose isomerase-like protein (cupin superfamily)
LAGCGTFRERADDYPNRRAGAPGMPEMRTVAKPGALVMVPAGMRHHVRNAGTTPLFFLTVYARPVY